MLSYCQCSNYSKIIWETKQPALLKADERRSKVRRREKGFTLLELIIVVIVIGILASIALPQYIKVVEKGRLAEAKSMLSAIRSAQIRYCAQWNQYSHNLTTLDAAGQTKYFTFPNPNPTTATDTAIVGIAMRNTSVDYSAGTFGTGYNISITAGGNFTVSNASLNYLL